MTPIKQRAAFVSESGLTFGLVDVPKPGPGQILVKVVAAAQNPTDCQSVPFSSPEMLQNPLTHVLRIVIWLYDCIQGRVFDVYSRKPNTAASWATISPASLRNLVRMFLRVCGPSATASRVLSSAVSLPFYSCFWYHPPDTESHAPAVQANGAFSEYLVARAELEVVPIPDGWSFEEAAQLGVAPITALQCLHETLELPSPFEAGSTAEQPQRTILIWGGASAVGQYSIQFAKLCGLRVLTTASSKNFDLVKGLGADEVFDYRDEGAVEKIRAATGNALDIAIDTISEGKTPAQVTGAIGDKGGKVAIILPYESPRPTVKVIFSMVPDLLRVRSVRPSLFVYGSVFLGNKRQVVCQSFQTDPRHGKGQAYPGFHTTQRTCWSKGWSEVHAGWEGKSDFKYQ